MFAAAACEQSDPVQNEFPIAYDYALTLPASFAKQDVMGIDSKVEEFVSDDTVISTDFGHYGAPPQCEGNDRSCQVEEEAIGEFQVLYAAYLAGPDFQAAKEYPYRVHYHVIVKPQQGLDLNLFASCKTETACNVALSHFRRVRIFAIEPPVRDTSAPPPPAITQ